MPAASAGTQLSFEVLGAPLHAVTFVVLDLETTGLSPDRDRITEVGAVRVRGGDVDAELATLVHPGVPIPPAVTAVTGITDHLVRDAPPIAAVLPLVLELLGDHVLVAHNARFDLGFLQAAARRLGLTVPDPVVVDTARLARRLVADEVPNLRLATLASHLRSPVVPDHRALTDARATVDVLHGLLERAGTLGATTLEDLRDLQRSRSDRRFRRIDLVREAPRAPGVYRFLDARGDVLYLGKATDLRARLRSYFGQDPRRRTADLVRETAAVRWRTTATLIEAEVEELRGLHTLQPRYNRRSTRPEREVWVALTREAFPRLVVTRAPGPSHRRTIGPFASRQVAEQVVLALQETLPIRTCTARLRVAQDTPACVLKELGRCAAPCDGSQSRRSYATDVDTVEAAFDDPSGVLGELRTRMTTLAADGRFERAAELRGRLHTTARALLAVRRGQALQAAGRVLAVRTVDERHEVVVLERGALVASLTLTGPGDDQQVLAAVAAHHDGSGALPAGSREERVLVQTWLERPGTRLVAADPGWSEPLAGGAVLTAVLAEARRTERRLRQDRQTLAHERHPRRVSDTDQVSSNHGLQASGSSPGAPGTRPSQLTRTR